METTAGGIGAHLMRLKRYPFKTQTPWVAPGTQIIEPHLPTKRRIYCAEVNAGFDAGRIGQF
jgi:hypothetical protein